MVYIITDTIGHIKVGVAKDMYARINVLQTGNPQRLYVLFQLDTVSPRNDRLLERVLLNKFRKYAIVLDGGSPTEWFKQEVLDQFDISDSSFWRDLKNEYGLHFNIEVHSGNEEYWISKRRNRRLIKATTNDMYGLQKSASVS